VSRITSEYSRYALYGVIAGLITGLVLGVASIVVLNMIAKDLHALLRDVLKYQLDMLNLPPETYEEVYNISLSRVDELLPVISWIAPIAYVIQYVLLGALFGLLQNFIRLKAGVKPSTAALLTGVVFTLLIHILPLVLVSFLYSGLIDIVSKYFNPVLIYVPSVVPGVVFTLALLVVSSVKGPWAKIVESKPRTY